MNTVNASTGFSGFQLKMGRSPRLIPPIVPASLPDDLRDLPEAEVAKRVIECVASDSADARDNLLAAKVSQVHAAAGSRGPEDVYKLGDLVMLSTLNRHKEFKHKGELRVAKFFPRWDRPYEVIAVHSETSNYTLDLPNAPNVYPTYHVSQLKRHVANDDVLFPSRAMDAPGL